MERLGHKGGTATPEPTEKSGDGAGEAEAAGAPKLEPKAGKPLIPLFEGNCWGSALLISSLSWFMLVLDWANNDVSCCKDV